MSDEEIVHMRHGALLHDMGKIGIPDSILLKPGRLDEAEFAVMKTHVTKGVALIDKIAQSFGVGRPQHIDVLRNIVHFHHEACDGSGYAEGLKGDAIPLEARVVAVADVFDALTMKRPYKEPWSVEDTIAEIRKNSGSHFEPRLVELFEKILPSILAIMETWAKKESHWKIPA